MLVNFVVFSTVHRHVLEDANGNRVLRDGHPVLVSESRFGWHVIGRYLFARVILDGVLVTLELTVIAMAIGVIGGVVLAIMRLSPNPLLSSTSWLYIWFFRGTPVYVQLFFWYDIGYLFTKISPNGGIIARIDLGIPFGPSFVHLNANTAITAFVAACIGLGFNEAAYMAEIVRAGIQSVDYGQSEAAQSLGMTRPLTLRRIVLPQAMRLIIPPLGNETISMLKTTSLASAITVTELFRAAGNIEARTYQTVPLLMVASLWYLAITSVLTVGQYYVERYYARGSSRQLPATPLQRLRHNLTTFRRQPAVASEPGLAT